MTKIILPTELKESTIGKRSSGLIIPASSGLIATDYNRPANQSQTLVICKSMVPIYNEKVQKNPNYFKDEGIRFVRILSDEQYGNLQRKMLQKLPMMSHKEYEEYEKSLANTGKDIQTLDLKFGTVLPVN